MAWYNTTGHEQDVIVSSRIRLARNITNYPFEPRLGASEAKDIIESVKSSLGDKYKCTDFMEITPTEAQAYAERNIISPEFASKKTPRALFEDDQNQVDIMVCEEDHIRIQCIMSGLSLDEAFIRACACDDVLDSNLDYAYGEELGYLTHCPTNLGTGMRASVMMFLPALTANRIIPALRTQLSKIGITIRGRFGEGSDTDGSLYQISNQITLGVSEDETIKKLTGVVAQITNQERAVRKKMYDQHPEKLCDKIRRSYGTMLYATLISSEEFIKLYSDVRLGIALGIITTPNLDYPKIDTLLVNELPANLTLNSETDISTNQIQRDKSRAAMVRNEMG
jgi:Arginine kinase